MDREIDNIHELFIEKTRKSPLLFNDLASMGNYIVLKLFWTFTYEL